MTLTKSQKLRRQAVKAVAPGPSNAKPTPKKPKASKKKNQAIPAAYGGRASNFTIKGEDRRTVTAQSWLTSVDVPIVGTSSVLQTFTLNPATLIPNSRLARYAQLYEKFLFEEIEFEYIPNVGTTQQGSLFMAVDADPDDAISLKQGISLMNAVSAVGKERFMTFPTYGTGSSIKLKVRGRDFFTEPLFVDPSKNGDRWAYAGQFFIGNVGAFAAAITAGTIVCRCKIHFMVPALEQPQSGGGIATWFNIVNPTGTYPWGSSASPILSGNANITYRLTRPDNNAAGSVIVFGDPGVYFIQWYQRGSSLSGGTFSYGGGASEYTIKPTGNYGNQTLHPNGTETIGLQMVNVSAPGGFVEFQQGGSHNTLLPSYVAVFLTNMQLAPSPSVLAATTLLSSLKLQLNDLERQVKMSRFVRPMQPGEEFTTTTSGSISGQVQAFNGSPYEVSESTTSTSETIGTSFLPDLTANTRSVKSVSTQNSDSPTTLMIRGERLRVVQESPSIPRREYGEKDPLRQTTDSL
jgi:hypothetical protein